MEVSIFRLRHRDVLTLCVISLLLLGIIMVQSAAMHVTGSLGFHWTERATRHALFACFAIATFFIVSRIDYKHLLLTTHRNFTNLFFWGLAITAFMCLIVLVPHIGIEKNGARRWLPLGICQVQPSELAKWAIVLFLSWWLTARPVDLGQFSKFLLTLVPVGVIAGLVVIQDFGTAALIALATLLMLLVGRVKLWHLLAIMPPVLLAGFWFVYHKEYRWRRMTAFLDPYSNPREGYHIIQSLLSFATGGVPGKGLGNGVQKLGYLPEDTTDFIFAVICEELGLFGALLTIVLYLGILWVAWQAVKQKRDSFGRMLAFGIGAMITLQTAINVAVATVSVPTKGLSLPLVSAGGSGLVITCAALGLLCSVLRFEHPLEQATGEPANKPREDAGPRILKLSPRPRVVTESLWQKWTR